MILRSTSVAAGPATATSHAPPPPSPTSLIPPYGSEQWNSFIGIITAIVGNVLISFALNTQRYAHIRLEREWQEKERQRKRRSASYRSVSGAKRYRDSDNEESTEEAAANEADPLLPADAPERNTRPRPSLSPVQEEDGIEEEPAYKQKSYLKSPYWWTGIIMMTCGEAGNFLAYGFAPASIVSPLGVVALISNCIIAPILLKEPFRARDAMGVLVAVGGAVTVVLSANDNNPKLGPDEIWSLISTWEFETYFGITVAIMVALVIASNRYGEKNILIDLGLVGLFGGYTALSTKGVASMLNYTLWRAITFPVTYLLVAILIGTAVMQIKYINRALQRFDATQVIPVQFVLFTLSVILGSAILYRDFERTSGDDAGKFVGGCALTFMGVWLITSGRPKRTEDDEEDWEPEPEDAINLVDGERYRDDGEHYRDEVDDVGDENESSRRSSTIRAASPSAGINKKLPTPNVPRPSTPDITVTTPESQPQTPSTPPSNPLTNPWDQSPANLPYTHRPISPLARNNVSTLSTPNLPSHSPEPPRATTSSPELSTGPPPPATPTRQTSDTAAITPATPGTHKSLRRIATSERVPGARNSLSGPLLASPLSTSLSAMMADANSSKRNSVAGLAGRAPQRGEAGDAARRQSLMGLVPDDVNANAEFGEPLARRRTGEELGRHGGDRGQLGRQRSLSGTLNELWRGWRGQGQGQGQLGGASDHPEGDVETAPHERVQ